MSDPQLPSKVLFVDDDAVARMSLRRTLSDLNAVLVEAETADQALAFLEDQEFAVAILDVCLPGIDGLELAARLRRGGRNPQLPVIFLTGETGDDSLLRRGYDLGAVDFLEKTVSAGFLRAKVAVFVDIDQRQRVLLQQEREQQKVARQQEDERNFLERIEQSLPGYRALSSEGNPQKPQNPDKTGHPIKHRNPDAFKDMLGAYVVLFESYQKDKITTLRSPDGAMDTLVRKLGAHGGGPRDLLDIHVAALEDAVHTADPGKAQAYAVEGRLLALETMGILVDYYRAGIIVRSAG